MRLGVVGCLVLALFISACASQRRHSFRDYAVPPSSPPPVQPVAAPMPPPQEVTGPFALELRADRTIGLLGARIAVLRQMMGQAYSSHDVVRVNCLRDKLTQVEVLERRAGQHRSVLRAALLEDDNRAEQELRSLETLERDSNRLSQEGRQCVGEEASNVSESLYSVRGDTQLALHRASEKRASSGIVALDSRVDQLKEQTARARARNSLVADSLLATRVNAPLGTTGGGGLGGLAAGLRGLAAQPQPPPSSPPAATTLPKPPSDPSGRHDPSMLLRSAELTLAVFEVDKNIDAVQAAAIQLGGYLALRGDRQIVIRVPRDRFDDALRRVEKLGDVLHRNVSAEDVTDQYVDLEMRLRNALAVRARLEALLASATVHDAIDIHRELGKVTEEIERLEGKLKLLRDRIAWSTITITFERIQQHKVSQQALLPFPWMNVLGLQPLLSVPR